MNCQICLENYNKSSQQCIKCHFCDYEACSKCTKRYILQTLDSHCMNCKRLWTREFLMMTLSKSFVNNEYRKHVQKITIEKEKALLTYTQPFVEREIQLEKLKSEYSKKMKELRKLRIETESLKQNMNKIKTEHINEAKTFIKKCGKEDCRGFVSTDWKCNLCDSKVCQYCLEIKNDTGLETHVCNEDNVKSASLILTECKKCPKCATMIYKTDGCDLMWCVICHTAFSWKSGKIEKGVIHNPHYLEHVRQNGQQDRNPLEIQCGRELDRNFINYFNNQLIDTVIEDRDYDILFRFFVEKIRKIVQLQTNLVPSLVTSNSTDNLDLRVAFMRNKITEEQWKRALQQRQKRNERNKVITNVLVTYINAFIDIIYRVAETNEWDSGMRELNYLYIYTRDELYRVSDIYNCSVTNYVVSL